MSQLRSPLLIVTLLLWGWASPLAHSADEPGEERPGNPQPGDRAEEPVQEPEPTVAVIRGTRVNLRVGPRRDVLPVRTLEDGTVLLIVERVPGWVGVRVPVGFPVTLSGKYVEAVGVDAVRVNARKLNVRVAAPETGRPLPGAFRDHPVFGAVLPLIGRSGGWLRVLAPEGIRAYVSDRFVRELGPLSEHREIVEAARAQRRAYVRKMASERQEAAAQESGLRLREALGAAQQALYRLRIEGGYDRTPVVIQINTLEKAMQAGRAAPVDARKLARAIRADMEAELEIRTARKDAEVARLRGLEPEPEPARPRERTLLVVQGEVRWEAAPKWRNGGAYVLWRGEVPLHVLRLTTGLPRPLPDLKGSTAWGLCTIQGLRVEEKVFGLPVLEVRSIKRAKDR